ncbi:MAG: hypothetical protein Q7R57_01125 [Dehalococcoidales bacterium]|nr:hypothetical protein [Dehalococcoidales bacterium]
MSQREAWPLFHNSSPSPERKRKKQVVKFMIKRRFEATGIKVLEMYLIFGLVMAVVALLYVWTVSPLGTSDRVGITTAISTSLPVFMLGTPAKWLKR